MEITDGLSFNGRLVISAHSTYSNSLTLEGDLVLEDFASILHATVSKGNVKLNSHTNIKELSMLSGGEIFFLGECSHIHILRGTGLIIHVPRTCTDWMDFVDLFAGTTDRVLWDID